MTAPQPCSSIFYTVFYPVSSVFTCSLLTHGISSVPALPMCSAPLHPSEDPVPQQPKWTKAQTLDLLPRLPTPSLCQHWSSHPESKADQMQTKHFQRSTQWVGMDKILTALAPNTKSPWNCTLRCHCFFQPRAIHVQLQALLIASLPTFS